MANTHREEVQEALQALYDAAKKSMTLLTMMIMTSCRMS